MLSEDGVREHCPAKGEGERDGRGCSPHDCLL
jgi:hypothetical protein